jgi:hypothetical protein
MRGHQERNSMQTQEMYLPIGSISLTKEQSDQVKSSFDKELDSLPLFRVVPYSSADTYVQVVGVPGLVGIVAHYGPLTEEIRRGGEVIASLPANAASSAETGRPLAAKPAAPQGDENRANPRMPPKRG